MPAPSPMTKPARRASKGREAFKGSCSSDSAMQVVKPATARGVIVASVPPATMASA